MFKPPTMLKPPVFVVGRSRNIAGFLQAYPPSTTSAHTHGPWIWVTAQHKANSPPSSSSSSSSSTSDYEQGVSSFAIKYTQKTLSDLTATLQKIAVDPSLPKKQTKETRRSKRVARDEAVAQATERIVSSARQSGRGDTCGKWLFFARAPAACDTLWRTLATSLVEGPLADTPADCLKISTVDDSMSTLRRDQHWVICLYLPDIFNRDAAREVFFTLLDCHGLTPTSAKPDLYTLVGLNSKHPSGMRPSIWTPRDFLSQDEIAARRRKWQWKWQWKWEEEMQEKVAQEGAGTDDEMQRLLELGIDLGLGLDLGLER